MPAGSRAARATAASVAVGLLAVATVAPSAAVAQKAKPASFVLAAPAPGDVSYGVVQVRRTSTKVPRSRPGATRAVGQTVGTLGIDIRSSAWKRLRRTTKVYVATAPVQGQGSAAVRNVLVFLVRKKTKATTPKTASFTVKVTNATANRSFWVRSVSAKTGRATTFTVRNALTTALGNWSGYLKVLGARNALRAAHRPIDVHGRFRQAPPQTAGTISTGGAKMNARTRTMYELIFGTLGEPLSYQAAKKSPAVVDFIRAELGNAAVATRWADVAKRLPLQVPDTYAAAARTEAQFVRVPRTRITARQVTIRDQVNSTQQAAIEAPRITAPTVPGTRITVQITGSGSGALVSAGGEISCPPVCSHLFVTGDSVDLDAKPAAGSEIASFEGCTKGNPNKGETCRVGLVTDRPGPSLIVAANFRPKVPATGGGGAPDVSGLPPATLDPTFGLGGVESLPFSQGGMPRSAYVNRIATGPDGKFVLIGLRERGSAYDWATARYTANGALDTYGSGGTATFIESGIDLGGRDAAVAPSGRILLVGETTALGDVRVYGLTPAGTPDGTFGSSGLASIPVPGALRVRGQAVAIQPDGRIVVAGDYADGISSRVFAARFTADGTPDPTFDNGGDGLVTLPANACDIAGGGGSGCQITDMAMQTAGGALTGLVLSGFTIDSARPGYSEGVVLRLAPQSGAGDVQVDALWGDAGTPGRRVLDPDRVASATAIVGEPDGSLVLSGRTSANPRPQCTVAKITPQGGVDTAFGAGGSITLALPDGCEAPGLARRAAGGYVIAGSDFALDTHAVLGRVSASGQPDSAFAAGGVRTVPSAGSPGFFNDVVVVGDRIVAAGGAFPYPHRFQIAGYTGG
ncbi:hypothetical protein [Paraconexibacter algicola]|uniref:Delta-60 repeat protein n=1 Tax=Paraconexibacter algicola TaxID=2133960 RepID=A0A2T4UKF9_9ACTN|nr:hypothetical protein [Paraconexibacter algicola]PTL59697.1 hypothetical protein C7Y72_08555 [Paraconexibacter algicola]